nr:GNAT family N-acetyltransferase [Lachnospiraceae bacterium]
MQKEYKELLITDEINIAKSAKAAGRYVVLCYPLKGDDVLPDLSDFPYAVENAEELDENYLNHVLCRLKGIPCHILDTDRCRVREITPEDVDELYEIYAQPGITDYMEDLYENREDEIAYTLDYIRYHYGFYDFGMWIVEDKQSGTIIGRAGFDMRPESEIPELGFLVRTEYQKQGYATEVCDALLSYGKEYLGFDEVVSYADAENAPSVGLLKKLGFVFREAEIVQSTKTDGRKLDGYLKKL